jgi:small subunit ribosomal protein S4
MHPANTAPMLAAARRRANTAPSCSEKQKAKYTYGILERQFEKMFHTAASKKGITGEVLLQLVRSALGQHGVPFGHRPNTSCCTSIGEPRPHHRDGVVNIPSYTLRPGQTVAVRERSRSAWKRSPTAFP